MRIPLLTYENTLDELDFLHKVRQANADIAVVCSYNKKFPPELLKCVKDGFVNLLNLTAYPETRIVN